ncbi:MAG TPA: cysteine peptidase family C39 domain-containing protein [bacterium]|jgi:predicted double-glycine peptidase|nr:cysteine peptidase family C39 domain-containing protein [bacterium]
MNPLFIPTLLVTIILYFVAWKTIQRQTAVWFGIVGALAALPAMIFAVYYLKIFGEAQWLYTYRSWPFTELSAVGLGIFAGWLQYQREQSIWFKRSFSRLFIPSLMVVCVAAPYAKQILMPADWSKYSDTWSENVCLQSSESSCGPASAATLLHEFGQPATEKQIAQESFTTRRGTENWYLLRTLRKHGVDAHYVIAPADVEHIQYPAIAGVILKGSGGAGHFIAILGAENEKLIIGDPLIGRQKIPRALLSENYIFTGFYIVISNKTATKH